MHFMSHMAMNNNSSPMTPTPAPRFPPPRIPLTSFDVADALKREENSLFSLTDEQISFCKHAIVQLKQKLAHTGARTPIDREFDGMTSEGSIVQQTLMKMQSARLAKNQPKNRYVNVLPFDDTRVKLDLNSGSNVLSDYINASFIMDPEHENVPVFIATQGPLKSTVLDFWQMVVQQKCPVIVMLTRLVDGNHERCAHYYPIKLNQSLLMGPLQVTNKSTNYLKNGLTFQRILEIRNIKSSEADPHTLIHLEYLDWPDFGVPSSTAPVRELIRSLHSVPTNAGPFVVHCSAGIGRTGTFCTIDHSLRRILSGDVTALDVGLTVTQFRSQRNGMVQTREQFHFIYEAIVDELEELVSSHER